MVKNEKELKQLQKAINIVCKYCPQGICDICGINGILEENEKHLKGDDEDDE